MFNKGVFLLNLETLPLYVLAGPIFGIGAPDLGGAALVALGGEKTFFLTVGAHPNFWP